MKSTVYAHLENDYRFYRLPLFRATAVKYGWNNPIGDIGDMVRTVIDF